MHLGAVHILRNMVWEGVFPIYYNITMGRGGGGVFRDPKFVLRNIWTAPNANGFGEIIGRTQGLPASTQRTSVHKQHHQQHFFIN